MISTMKKARKYAVFRLFTGIAGRPLPAMNI
jgi:hypothetical protein